MWSVRDTYVAYMGGQRTPEWYALRKGRITASNAAAALGISKYTSKRGLVNVLSRVNLPGEAENGPVTPAMVHGIEHEAKALSWYCESRGVTVDPIGFAYSLEMPRLGVSTDGLVGDDGIIEIKCPYGGMYEGLATDTKSPTLSHIPVDHYAQVQMGMGILERKWCDYIVADFVSAAIPSYYVERIPYNHQYWTLVKYKLNRYAEKYFSGVSILTSGGMTNPSTPLTTEEFYRQLDEASSH